MAEFADGEFPTELFVDATVTLASDPGEAEDAVSADVARDGAPAKGAAFRLVVRDCGVPALGEATGVASFPDCVQGAGKSTMPASLIAFAIVVTVEVVPARDIVQLRIDLPGNDTIAESRAVRL